MSDTVKLIIEISKEDYERCTVMASAIRNGIPLDSDSERAEVQAYFAGEAYGWEQGRKALIDDVKQEVWTTDFDFGDYCDHTAEIQDKIIEILDNIDKESEKE